MAGQAETDTKPVGGTGAPDVQQAESGAGGAGVSDGSDNAPESRATGQSKEQAGSADSRVSEFEYRVKKLEREVSKMRKVFLDHTHETLNDTPPPAANVGEAPAGAPEVDAVKPAIAEKPPVQTKEREQKRTEAQQQYFTRIHRQKRRTRVGVDD